MDILELKNTVIKPNEKLSGKKKKAQWMARQQNGGYTEGKKSVKRMTGQHKLPNPSKREKRDRKDEQSHRDLGTKTKDVTFIMLLKSQ